METVRKIEQWAEDRNLIEGSDIKSQMVKLIEEIGELAEGIAKNKPELVVDSIGDACVVLTIMARQAGTTLDECLDIAYSEILPRKGRMVDGIFVKEGC